MKYIALVMIFIAVFNKATAAGEQWKLRKENEHLKIYTAEVEHSPFKAVRVECNLKGSFSQVIAALFDIDRHKDWIFNDKYSKLLKQYNNELIYYSEVSVPWPFLNRDYVAHITVSQPAPNTVVMISRSEPDDVPVKNNIVRIRTSSSVWTMTALGSNQLHIEYTIEVDPAGLVPAWLTNLFIVKGPYETFEQLLQRINMPEYKNRYYSFIKEPRS